MTLNVSNSDRVGFILYNLFAHEETFSTKVTNKMELLQACRLPDLSVFNALAHQFVLGDERLTPTGLLLLAARTLYDKVDSRFVHGTGLVREYYGRDQDIAKRIYEEFLQWQAVLPDVWQGRIHKWYRRGGTPFVYVAQPAESIPVGLLWLISTFLAAEAPEVPFGTHDRIAFLVLTNRKNRMMLAHLRKVEELLGAEATASDDELTTYFALYCMELFCICKETSQPDDDLAPVLLSDYSWRELCILVQPVASLAVDRRAALAKQVLCKTQTKYERHVSRTYLETVSGRQSTSLSRVFLYGILFLFVWFTNVDAQLCAVQASLQKQQASASFQASSKELVVSSSEVVQSVLGLDVVANTEDASQQIALAVSSNVPQHDLYMFAAKQACRVAGAQYDPEKDMCKKDIVVFDPRRTDSKSLLGSARLQPKFFPVDLQVLRSVGTFDTEISQVFVEQQVNSLLGVKDAVVRLQSVDPVTKKLTYAKLQTLPEHAQVVRDMDVFESFFNFSLADRAIRQQQSLRLWLATIGMKQASGIFITGNDAQLSRVFAREADSLFKLQSALAPVQHSWAQAAISSWLGTSAIAWMSILQKHRPRFVHLQPAAQTVLISWGTRVGDWPKDLEGNGYGSYRGLCKPFAYCTQTTQAVDIIRYYGVQLPYEDQFLTPIELAYVVSQTPNATPDLVFTRAFAQKVKT